MGSATSGRESKAWPWWGPERDARGQTCRTRAIHPAMAAGQIVDRWCPTELYMAGSHLLGGLFLLAAARAGLDGG